MKVDLNLAYDSYLRNPTAETYEFLGKELLVYLKQYTNSRQTQFNNRTSAEDAVGETCVKVIQNLTTFNSEKSSFKTWVTTILTNNYLNLVASYTATQGEPLDKRAHLDHEFEDRMVRKLTAKKLIANLPKDDQTLLRMKFEGKSNTNIAENMGLTTGSVEQRLIRTKKFLQAQGGAK